MKKILTLLFALFIQQSLQSFPGDHNSLTCDQNFQDTIKAVIYKDADEFASNTNTPRFITDTDLSNFFRKSVDEVKKFEPYKLQNRNNIIAAINADIKKPATSLIFKKIKDGHDNTFEGKPLQVTKWGGSLSDFIYFYELTEPACIYYPHYSIEEVTK